MSDIRIDVHRLVDGQVTRLEGESGIAVCCPPLADDVVLSDPGIVSIRCSTTAQLAWNLAVLLATVRNYSLEAYMAAHELEIFVDAGRPQHFRQLPNPPAAVPPKQEGT